MDGIRRGTLIVSSGIALPASASVRTASCCDGWRKITNMDAHGLDKRMNDMGWTCFQRAAPETANVLGFGGPRTLEKALRRIIRRLGVTKFNCLEITQITQRSFAGISYVHVTAGARNIRQRPV
jgi:hypothetical protein